MKFRNIGKWTTEKISQRVFYVLIALSALTFGLFFLVGYDMPFEENPDFNAPLFTNVLLGLMVFLLVMAMALTAYSLAKGARLAASQGSHTHGVPERKIVGIVWGATVLLLALSFLLGSSVPMPVNRETYSDWLWLKVSDMFVFTSIVMLLAAIGAVLFGATRYIRKEKK